MNTLPTIFSYQEQEVRTFLIDNEIYFVVVDACKILEIKNVSDAVKRLDPDGVAQGEVIDALGRKQNTTLANEPNLYRLIFRSEKPEAKAFQDWVYKEVIPSIRKTGSYAVSALTRVDVLDDPRRLTLAIRSERALLQHLQAELALRYPDRARISHQRIRGPKEMEDRILHVLRRHGPISMNTLHHSYMKNWDAPTIEQALSTMMKTGHVIQLQTERGWIKYAVA